VRLLFVICLMGQLPMTKSITRVDIYKAVQRKVGLTQPESLAVVELVLEEIAGLLEKGETVKLSSFGSFVVRKKEQRPGRNPITGTEVPISPRRVVVFKSSAVLKQRINGQRSVGNALVPEAPQHTLRS
jgi:integration host factor subunit alpha